MKQLALEQLLSTIYGAPRFGGQYDICRWDEVEDEDIARWIADIVAVFRQIASVDGVWPGVWVPIALESFEEFQQIYCDDEEEELRVCREEEYSEIQWIRVEAREDVREQTVFLSPSGIQLIYRTTEKLAVVPTPWSDQTKEKLRVLLAWLDVRVSGEVAKALSDPAAYHQRLEVDLPREERLGWFRRSDLWSAAPEEEQVIRSELTEAQRREFAELAPVFEEDQTLQDLMANDYFRFVEICYEGAGYEGLEGLSPREKYEELADRRHAGLLDIDPGSREAFLEWIRHGSSGGHPWEIARGGNSTHISLFLHFDDDGYHLSLAGTAETRAAETIRMALALHGAGIPVKVRDADLHRRRVLGEDLIAIVPNAYFGAYPYTIQSLFPDDVAVHDHSAHGLLEGYPVLAEAVRWLPLPRIAPA
jgi:hypothetical protein